MTGTVAEISVDRAVGAIKVHNLWCVADVGLPVQPGNIEAQIESSLIYSLSAALKERITIKNGHVEQSNFHDYQVMRMSEVPEIKVEIVSSGPIPLPVGETCDGRDGAGDRQRVPGTDRQAAARSAVHAGPGEEGAGVRLI